MTTSTQQAYPVRASRRTAVQNALSVILVVGVVAPIIAAILHEELSGYLPEAWLAWVVGAAAVLAAVSAALARIMAIPAVDAWLRHLGLSSTPPLALIAPPGVLERGDHVTITATGQGGTVFYVEQREDGWHYGIQLDGSDLVAMYRLSDLT
ncbi:hypothetical protein ACFWGN_20595 [Oerskovia sp. NPDC060338]|uniref:hypothetical protein n=1 Tax=Oerskovia sp. NPDC060338 TaxID=3347100 RepID=UPI00365EF577